MGTDIHGVLQSRVDGRWVTHEQIPDDRSYLLFGILADVRGCQIEAGPISIARGLPKDFDLDDAVRDLGIDPDSWKAQEDWLVGDHHLSWLSVAEILAFAGWDEMMDGSFVRGWCEWFLNWLEEATGSTPGSDHRIVFGFDS